MTDAFLSGASICISIITCDIGKNVMKQYGQKTVATMSSFIDGFAGFGSLLG